MTAPHDASPTPDEIARRSAAALWQTDTASRALGMEIVEVGAGRATVTMPVTPAMANGHGSMHGGYIFTLADTAFSYACNSHDRRAVAQHAQISFIAPGRPGSLLTAIATERQRADRSGIYDVTVHDESGTTIAEFRGWSRTIPGTYGAAR